MLRNRQSISLQFTNNPSQQNEKLSSISLYQCMVYLIPSYHLFSQTSPTCRRSVIFNHYLSLRTLSKFNSFIDFNRFLNFYNTEHLLVIDLLFIQRLRTLCPRPFLRLPPMEKTSCSEQEYDAFLEMIPDHLLSLVNCVFSFCMTIYHRYHMVLLPSSVDMIDALQ